MICCFGVGQRSKRFKIYRCKIVLLDDTELIHEIKESQKGQDILDIVFKHLDLLETVYFGLRFIDTNGHSCWLDPTKSVLKQIKSIDPITFFFSVKFYASDPCKLREECTRYQFFLQLKQDVQRSRLPVTNELAAQLLAYIIQSELGDYDPKIHHYGYISEFSWIDTPSLDFENIVCDLHKKLIGQVPAVVEMQFLERIKWLDLYGCELYPVVAEDRHEYFLGLGPHGIIVLKNKLKIGNYFWPRIEKVWHKGKYFMMKIIIDKNNQDKTYGFEMLDRLSAKRIHRNCKEHKEFFKLSQSVRIQNLYRQFETNGKSSLNSGLIMNHDQNDYFNRPNPSLVRISSWRLKRHGRPDGSEVPDDTGGGSMPRFNSTPSLHKSSPPEYNSGSPYKTSGLFSKSASASPLSVRSAFVARYDYGRNNYVSPIKRNNSSLSHRKNRRRSSDFDIDDDDDDATSDISRRSIKSRHSDGGPGSRRRSSSSSSVSSSRRRRRHHHNRHEAEPPRMVEWTDILDRRNIPGPPIITGTGTAAVVRKISGNYQKKYHQHPETFLMTSPSHDPPFDDPDGMMMAMAEQETTTTKRSYTKIKQGEINPVAAAAAATDIFKSGNDTDRYQQPEPIRFKSSEIGIGSKSEKRQPSAASYFFESRDNNNLQHTSAPRVKFQSIPHTAYYSTNNHVFSNNNNNNNKTGSKTAALTHPVSENDNDYGKIFGNKISGKKSSRNEMRTEL